MNPHEEYEFTQCSSDCMNSNVPLCVFVPDKEYDSMTDTHIKLNNLDDTQECLSNSNHKIAFDYDKDTMSLAEEITLDTSEVLLSDNTISSARNATIAFEYHCYEIEADTPRSNYHGPKTRLHIPVFRNLFFGPKNPFLPGFLRNSFFTVFSGGFFHRNLVLEVVAGIPVFAAVTGFFCRNSCGTGIPVFTTNSSGFLRIPPDSCSRQTLSGSGQRLNKALC